MPEHICPDCRWLETRVDFDAGMNYACRKGKLEPGATLLDRKPCADFELSEELKNAGRPAPRRGHGAGAPAAPPRLPARGAPSKTALPPLKIMSEHEAVRRFISDGDHVGFSLFGAAHTPLSIVRELVRQGKKRLRLRSSGLMDAELLAAAGLLEALDLTAPLAEVLGRSPVLRRAAEKGGLRILERTDAAPALECAVVHVRRADVNGNAQLGSAAQYTPEAANAAKRLIITAEEIVSEEAFAREPARTIIPFYLVNALVHAPFGAHPGEACGLYRRDEDLLTRYAKAVRTEAGTRAYLGEWVTGLPDHLAYRRKVGLERLENLR